MYYFCGKKLIEKHFKSIIMQEYILLVIILIIIAYVYSYYKYPMNISILQTRPFEFNSDMLLEKQPIVIENNDSKLEELKSVFFRYNPNDVFNLSASDNWHRNRYKYIALQLDSQGEVLLCPPASKMIQDKTTGTLIPDPSNTNLLAIQAKKGEIIIIPLHWSYLITNTLNVKCIGIHDLITFFLP